MSDGVVVVGGGVAGAAAACRLALAGLPVQLLEREAAPADKVCGEFLSGEALPGLRRLGLDLQALGGTALTHVRLVAGRRSVRATLPFPALGLSRRRLDEALLRQAVACGAIVRRGRAAAVHAGPDGLAVRHGDSLLRPDALLLATGKHDLRGLRRTPRRPPEALVGFKTYFALAAPQRQALEGHVEIAAYADGYAGLLPVEDGRANLCLLVGAERLRRCGGNWDGLLRDLLETAPHLAGRLRGARMLLRQPLSISRVPYGFVHRPAPDDPPDLFRLGDQAAVIPSFAGDGMAIALHSAALAAATLLAGGDGATYHRRLREDVAGQVRRAGLLHDAGRTVAGQAALLAAGRLWPGSLGWLARLTRVPRRALLGTGDPWPADAA